MLSKAERKAARDELHAASERAFVALLDRGFNFDFSGGGARLADPRVIQRGYDPTRVPGRSRSPGKPRAPSATSSVRYTPQTAQSIIDALKLTAPARDAASALVSDESLQRFYWSNYWNASASVQ